MKNLRFIASKMAKWILHSSPSAVSVMFIYLRMSWCLRTLLCSDEPCMEPRTCIIDTDFAQWANLNSTHLGCLVDHNDKFAVDRSTNKWRQNLLSKAQSNVALFCTQHVSKKSRAHLMSLNQLYGLCMVWKIVYGYEGQMPHGILRFDMSQTASPNWFTMVAIGRLLFLGYDPSPPTHSASSRCAVKHGA